MLKKTIIYGITILISASIPIYFLLIWEPLKAEDVMGNDIIYNDSNKEIEKEKKDEEATTNNIQIYNSNFFDNFDSITSEKKEKLNILISNLAIEDIIKINNYFKDLKNKENISEGMNLVKKRMTKENFQEFKGIIKEYVNLDEEDI